MNRGLTKIEFKDYFKIFINGFIFGIMLQLAIGPVCLYVFNSAIEKGFLYSELIITGVFLIDGFYITLAILGISALVKNSEANMIFKISGFIILFVFGISIILSEITKMNLIPSIKVFNNNNFNNPFLNGLLLTLSNPLTIIFWIGIFSSKIIDNKYSKNQVIVYGAGALIPTFIFLSTVAAIGIILKIFLSPLIISLLNIFIGLFILYFSFKLLLRKEK